MASTERFLRVDRLVSVLGLSSRRGANGFIRSRVTVDGVCPPSQTLRVDPARVAVDGVSATLLLAPLHIALHKPPTFLVCALSFVLLFCPFVFLVFWLCFALHKPPNFLVCACALFVFLAFVHMFFWFFGFVLPSTSLPTFWYVLCPLFCFFVHMFVLCICFFGFLVLFCPPQA